MFTPIDWFVLCGYFVILLITGRLFSRGNASTDSYYRAAGSIPAWAAGISLLATSLSAATFIGGPQQAFRGDLSYLSANIGGLVAVVIVAIYFVPRFYASGTTTVYAILEERMGSKARLAAGIAFLIGRVFASGARLYIAALPASLIVFGDIAIPHLMIAVAAMTIIGIIYTYAGGIRAVIWTDVIQTGIFLVAASAACIMLIRIIPIDLGNIFELLKTAGPDGSSKLTIFKPIGGLGPKDTYTILTAIFGFSLLNLGAYGTDQDLAQRMMTCKNPAQGSKSAVMGILIGIPVTMLFMLIGLFLFIFYSRPEIMGAAAPSYTPESSRQIFLEFILHEMPSGMSGLMMAGLFAAGLSSLNSAINAMSSSIVNDFYRRFRPEKSDSEYLKIGKFWVASCGVILGLFAALAVFWQAARPEATLIDFALMVMIFAYSGLVAVFLTAIFTKRGNEISAIAALLTGFLATAVMQYRFASVIAFPWQLTIATLLAFIVCVTGYRKTT